MCFNSRFRLIALSSLKFALEARMVNVHREALVVSRSLNLFPCLFIDIFFCKFGLFYFLCVMYSCVVFVEQHVQLANRQGYFLLCPI
jgi:hypothetical protein